MQHPDPSNASFEQWRDLARANPALFEERRRAAIAALISSAPPKRRQRLERLQWRIDRERERHPDPLAACTHLSRMMWDSVHGQGGLVAMIRELDARWRGLPPRELQRASIIPFPGGGRPR